jgi:cyclic pyranopterin phosphate synthase
VAELPSAEQRRQISRLVDMFSDLGVEKLRLTGGEPLVRRDLASLARMLAAKPRIRDLALTTNGVLLPEQAQALRDAGLRRVTVSLDTLRPERFTALTRADTRHRVREGIEAVAGLGFGSLKLNVVVMRSFNDDELVPLVEYGKRVGAEVRFIE